MKNRKTNPEHLHQCAYFRWLRYAYPELLVFAIPNGGKRTGTQGGWMVAEGLTKGIPDIMIASANGKYHGMFIEMKATTKPSKSQLQIMQKLEQEGYKVEVCYTWEAAKIVTEKYLTNTQV